MPYPPEEAEGPLIVVDPADLWVGTAWFDACWHGGKRTLAPGEFVVVSAGDRRPAADAVFIAARGESSTTGK